MRRTMFAPLFVIVPLLPGKHRDRLQWDAQQRQYTLTQ